MFFTKALSWSPPEFYKVTWWRGQSQKKVEGEEELVKRETLPPVAPAVPPASSGKAWLRWSFQLPAVPGYLKWWGHDAGSGSVHISDASAEEIFVDSQQSLRSCFGVQEVLTPESMSWASRKASKPPSNLDTPEHFQICFNFIRHLVDLCVLSFLWLSSPVFRLCLDILGLGGLVKLWLHGMAMFLVASYGLHLVFWLVQEYLLQFACLFGLLQLLVLSVSIQAGLEVEEDEGDGGGLPAEGRFVVGGDRDSARSTPEPSTAPLLSQTQKEGSR